MRMGSVCSGILGAELAAPDHWETAWCSEIDPFASRVIAHHRPELRNYGDFTTIGPNAGTVDILCGGTPCQSFSTGGSRGGMDDPRGALSVEFAELAHRVNARWILWENVPGVLSSGGGRDFGVFLGALAKRGYFFSYRILDACFFGLAQRRLRVWVVGYLGDWRPPAAVLFEPPSLRGDYHEGRSSVRPRGTVFDPQNEDALGQDRSSIAKCITTKPSNGCLSKVTLVEYDGRPRYLTPLESERAQGFPDNWTGIPGASNTRRYKAVGNAWPVNVARWIMARIDAVNEAIQ